MPVSPAPGRERDEGIHVKLVRGGEQSSSILINFVPVETGIHYLLSTALKPTLSV